MDTFSLFVSSSAPFTLVSMRGSLHSHNSTVNIVIDLIFGSHFFVRCYFVDMPHKTQHTYQRNINAAVYDYVERSSYELSAHQAMLASQTRKYMLSMWVCIRKEIQRRGTKQKKKHWAKYEWWMSLLCPTISTVSTQNSYKHLMHRWFCANRREKKKLRIR